MPPPNPDDPIATGVPFWAINLVTTVAEIRARVENIPNIEREIELIKSTTVSMREYEQLSARVGQLWDAHNATQGELATRGRFEQLWRWASGLAIAALTLWVLIVQSHIHFST